jgi:hypothetical protein
MPPNPPKARNYFSVVDKQMQNFLAKRNAKPVDLWKENRQALTLSRAEQLQKILTMRNNNLVKWTNEPHEEDKQALTFNKIEQKMPNNVGKTLGEVLLMREEEVSNCLPELPMQEEHKKVKAECVKDEEKDFRDCLSIYISEIQEMIASYYVSPNEVKSAMAYTRSNSMYSYTYTIYYNQLDYINNCSLTKNLSKVEFMGNNIRMLEHRNIWGALDASNTLCDVDDEDDEDYKKHEQCIVDMKEILPAKVIAELWCYVVMKYVKEEKLFLNPYTITEHIVLRNKLRLTNLYKSLTVLWEENAHLSEVDDAKRFFHKFVNLKNAKPVPEPLYVDKHPWGVVGELYEEHTRGIDVNAGSLDTRFKTIGALPVANSEFTFGLNIT